MCSDSKYWLIGLFFTLLCFALSSCSNYNPAYNRENIKATWIAEVKDGDSIAPPEQRMVYTFDKSGSVFFKGKNNKGDGNYKWSESSIVYSVNCCVLDVAGSLTGFYDIDTKVDVKFSFDIVKQRDSLLIITPTAYSLNDVEVEPGYVNLQMRKIPSTYAAMDSIIGVWEVKSRNGATYNEFRLMFSSSAFAFYTKDGEGQWVTRSVGEEGDDYCNLYYDFIAFTLYDNSIWGTASKWGVKCFSVKKASLYEKTLNIASEDALYHLELVTE